ncbi:MAG: DUF1648 domain-containing protein [Candidatus Krumholzibacteria bacterium]|nr:DUF1648 domain-containing protein [Candidatus Krumholzibacteria bacterium]
MFGRPAGLVFLLSLVPAAMALNQAGGELPERVASHFGITGAADGWSSRSSFLTVVGAVIAGTSLLLAGIGWLLPRLPFSLVSIPHPDYWLAPERRAGSWLLIQDFLLVVAAATNLFFVLLLRETVIANRLPQPHLVPVSG